VAIPTQRESIIRSVPLFFHLSEDQALPSLGMAAYLGYTNPNEITRQKNNRFINVDSLKIPLQNDGKYLINWYKKGGTLDGSFQNYSFYGLFQAGMEFRKTGNPKADSLIELKDKIVFIGANAAGLSDIKSTPMSPIEPFPGVEIHATVTNNLLEADFISTVSATTKNIILLLITLILLGVIFWAPSKINLPASAAVLILIVATGLILFGEFRVWFPTAELFLSSLFIVIIGYATKYVTEDAQKRAIRNAFDLYLQKELVEQIIEEPDMLKLGGDKKELTVLFSDLAGFTTLSEQTPPEELVTFLNEYLSEMTDIVFKNKGTLDKYIGDAIMAFWGAPVPEDDHAYYACKCVLEMEEKLKKLQQKWESAGLPAPHVRYGLNSGDMVVGNMGSKDRFSYTVLGDHVNLGARLEPANKDFGTKILISEYTHNKVKDRFLSREVALMKAKGKTKPIRIFELIGEHDSKEAKAMKPFVELFHGGLNHYYEREWDLAASKFEQALQMKEEDMLCQIYIKNIEVFKTNPPGENWEGSYQQINK
ncbi:MAG: adenylate/guanylate cyclase domain-containing protein, partial [Gracilimonas sp.]|nr:adenylate/guanylate cyclase domain-containing protein [Gracilimonas sp.]